MAEIIAGQDRLRAAAGQPVPRLSGRGIPVTFPGRPGRPRRAASSAPPASPAGVPGQGAGLTPAIDAGPRAVFAATVPPRGLSVEVGAAYLGVSRRELYRFVERGLVHLIRLPGCRRVLLDRHDLDRLLEDSKVTPPEPA